MIHWVDVLETGYREIDDDHRGLIDQCNNLTGLMQEQGAWAAVVAAAQQLAKDCAEHFRTEESILENTDFPRLKSHKVQHQRIEERFRELTDFLSSVDGSKVEHWDAARSMRATLVDILFRHDLDYKSHLQHAAGR